MGQELSAQQIIELVNKGAGSDDMFHGSTTSGDLSTQHNDVADQMLQLQGKMSQYWQGDAAGQANAGAGPLVQASKVSGEHLQQAGGLYNGQGNSFNTLKSKVQSAGDLGPRPSDDWVSGTWVSFLSNRADEIEQWDQKAQGVVDSYHAYYGESTDNSGRWANPSQYGELTMPTAGGDFSVAEPGGTGTGHLPSGYTPGGHGHAGGVAGMPDSGGGYTGGPGGTGGPGSSGASGGTGSHPGASAGGPVGGSHPGSGQGASGSGSYISPDGTTSSSYVPPAPDTGGSPNYWTPAAGQSGTAGGNSNTSGGIGFGPGGFGPGAGFGPGGSNAGGYGSGSGNSSGGLGRGAGAGAGALSEGSPARTGSPAAGAGGRPGSPGMGGMGAGGKGGKGEEDKEHKRADYLLEQDPDDALVGKLPKHVPPVIGA